MSHAARRTTRQPFASRNAGFTLLEIMVGVAIVAILGLISILGYQKYIEKARGSDLVVKYDVLRTTFNANTGQSSSADCADLARRAGTERLADDHAKLEYGFEAVPGGGYRPVLTVCATVDKNGPLGVKTARGAYETLSKNGVVEQNPVVTDGVVSFALRLTQGDQALCGTYTTPPATACGQASAPPPQAQPSYPGPAVCEAGQVRLLGETASGVKQWGCFDACPSGQARQPGMLNCVSLP
jgi:prepilin-type N-terminal cleavage/methylation domain-containing protein